MRKPMLLACICCFSFSALSAQTDAIAKIRKEGLDNSKVMDIAFHLTDVSGPRLTNSPGFFRAANWAKDELTKMGLVNAAIEPWGDFGTGWEQTRCYVAMTAPYYTPIVAIPRAWTGSTPGKNIISTNVILIRAKARSLCSIQQIRFTRHLLQMEEGLQKKNLPRWPIQNQTLHKEEVQEM